MPIFNPETCGHSQAITRLTSETPEHEIKECFVTWCKEVFAANARDIATVLELYINENKGTTNIGRVRRAAEILRKVGVIYGELIDEISTNQTLEEFLWVMRNLPAIVANEWAPSVTSGMDDAGIGERYNTGIWGPHLFKHQHANRLLTQRGILSHSSTFNNAVNKKLIMNMRPKQL